MILSMKELSYKRQGKYLLKDINWEFKKGRALGYFRP